MTNDFNISHNQLSALKKTKFKFQYVVNSSVEFIRRKYGSHIYYRKLLNGYRRFDPSRGMDYILDLIFINSESETEIHKR